MLIGKSIIQIISAYPLQEYAFHVFIFNFFTGHMELARNNYPSVRQFIGMARFIISV